MADTLSVKLKKQGVRSVVRLAESEGVCVATLYYWYKNSPQVLESAIERYLGKK